MLQEGPHADVAAVHWLDLATLVGIGGVWGWFFLGRLFRNPVVPLNDLALGNPAAAAAASAARAAHHHAALAAGAREHV